MKPKRIQMRRTKGWRKPAGTVYVGRPSRWGNPFVVHPTRPGGCEEHDFCCALTASQAVMKYRGALLFPVSGDPPLPDVDELRRELAGHDLACWCPPAQVCHADVLLEVANP